MRALCGLLGEPGPARRLPLAVQAGLAVTEHQVSLETDEDVGNVPEGVTQWERTGQAGGNTIETEICT